MDAATPIAKPALTNTAVLVKTGKVALRSLQAANPGNAMAYVQCFDAAAAVDVTLGTTVPNAVFGVSSLGTVSEELELGFQLGLVAACTASATGSGAPNAANPTTFGVRGEA